MKSLELVSFSLCPFVQRSVITLKHKGAQFQITYIDLESPPEWFEKRSPMGKVPILIVDGETTLFESAVINEYIDETVGTPLMPKEPLKKAFERAWIEYGSNLLGQSYEMTMEKEEEALETRLDEFFSDVQRLDPIVQGPYFRGKDFGLVDTAYAPLFMRLELSEDLRTDVRWQKMPHVQAWAKQLLSLPSVKESVIPGFSKEYVEFCQELGSLLY